MGGFTGWARGTGHEEPQQLPLAPAASPPDSSPRRLDGCLLPRNGGVPMRAEYAVIFEEPGKSTMFMTLLASEREAAIAEFQAWLSRRGLDTGTVATLVRYGQEEPVLEVTL
jgi:hypothetical protein